MTDSTVDLPEPDADSPRADESPDNGSDSRSEDADTASLDDVVTVSDLLTYHPSLGIPSRAISVETDAWTDEVAGETVNVLERSSP